MGGECSYHGPVYRQLASKQTRMTNPKAPLRPMKMCSSHGRVRVFFPGPVGQEEKQERG